LNLTPAAQAVAPSLLNLSLSSVLTRNCSPKVSLPTRRTYCMHCDSSHLRVYPLFFHKGVGHNFTQVPQKLRSGSSNGISFSIAGLEQNLDHCNQLRPNQPSSGLPECTWHTSTLR
jgi:hypothetical protein